MAVKLRVGIYHKKAASNKQRHPVDGGKPSDPLDGSKGAACRNTDVTDGSRLMSVARPIELLHQDQFVRQLEGMLPVFIGLAFPSLESRAGHGDPFAGYRRGAPWLIGRRRLQRNSRSNIRVIVNDVA